MRAYAIADERLDGPDIAVVGMAARLPGALDVFDFRRNLRDGVESIRRLSDEELRAAGVDGASLHDPSYVKAAAVLDRLELFDASFFGFSRREASVLDPQHRHFLEVCFEALENAGILPEAARGAIGVFAGSGMNAYLPYNLFTNPELMRSMGLFLVRHTGNDKDFLTTRASYCLDLKGPSINVQTACSTSLVAIHLACQSLLAAECDVALAGGVTIELPHHHGYRYEEGEILSPDGHCRPFDAGAKGTVFGSGTGVVVLRRLRDAVESGDHIHAIIKGSAVNNDGDRKVGYLAPSVDGQAECVVEALEVADLSAREISYIECHGTGTPVGDPIEVAALTEAFSRTTTEKQFCAIGSVKSNIGHLDTAAGVASFIKVVQMLETEELFGTLHYEKPNPQIDFTASPFFVSAERRPWPRSGAPRRAGVSSLGVGGTNAHVIVEEAPRRLTTVPRRKSQLLLLSARSSASLDALSSRLARHFEEYPDTDLSDVSSTLLFGRRRFGVRRVLAASTLAEARELLTSHDPARVFDAHAPHGEPAVVFLFPGGGAQHANMAREVYETEPTFREALDECLEILKSREGLDLHPLLFSEPERVAAASRELERPSLALPALLSVEIAFARLLESWGIRPAAMLGHSLGEYAAAHLAKVFSLEAALGLMCCRGRLFERVRPGGMLSVAMNPEALSSLLDGGLSIAAVNGPELSVVSGENASLDALEQKLAVRDVEARRLHIDVAAHSPLLDPILDEFRAYVRGLAIAQPERPYVSNVTGGFVDGVPIDAEYFVRHLRGTVQFSEGMATLLAAHPNAVFVEVGPGQSMTALVRQHPARRPEHAAIPLSPHAREQTSQEQHLAGSVGRMLAHGAPVDLLAFTRGSPRRMVSLPPTPFEHERHWIEPGKGYFMAQSARADAERESDVTRWFYSWSFREEARADPDVRSGEYWLVVSGEPLAQKLELELKARGVDVVTLVPGEVTERLAADRHSLALADPRAYDDVLQEVFAARGAPRRILHALCLTPEMLDLDAPLTDGQLDRAFYSLFHLLQVLGQEDLGGADLLVATCRAYDVAGTSTLHPLHALAQGPVQVAEREIPDIRARIFDLLEVSDAEAVARSLVDELSAPSVHSIVAERGRRRYVAALERSAPESAVAQPLGDRPVVLFTGGLGGIARTLAEHLANTRGARVVLASRSELPEPSEWHARRAALEDGDPRAEQLETLLELQAAGHEVVVDRVDVTSAVQVEQWIVRVRARFGGIDAVVHAAGVLDDAPLALKDRAGAAAVLGPKVLGARHLVDALRDRPPRFLLLLSSTSAAIGPPGQIDYVAANAYVSALGRSLHARWPGTRVFALGFGVWRDTGMAARAIDRPAQLQGEPTGHPLLQRERRLPDGTLEFESVFDVARLWVLDEHRVRGAGPVLPGTAIVEIARAAGARALGLHTSEGLEIRDAVFLSPLEVPEGAPRRVRVTVSRENGSDSLSVVLRSRGRNDMAWVEHASAVVSRGAGPPAVALPLADLEARCRARTVEFSEGSQVLPQDQHLAFGPRWHVLRSMRFGPDEAVARLELPEQWTADLSAYPLHPAVLDMASGFAFSLVDASSPPNRVRVPLSFASVRVFAPLEKNVASYVRLQRVGDSDGIAEFEVRVVDPLGRVLVAADGYMTKSIAPALLSGGGSRRAEPTLLDRWTKQGITREEGARVLDTLLASDLPAEVYAAPTSLFAMIDEIRGHSAAQRSESAPVSVAPSGRASDAPRDDIERRLAAMWQSLLGLETVGIRDNFFELGGHSLIAVRLFGRIKKAYGLDLPLAVLFQVPTIETCADMLRTELGIAFENGSPREEGPALTAQRELSHVVAIQNGVDTVPIFCVHGAGGNVLNFRDIARHLGKNQAFYGLQARGVRGEDPAASIEEMADLYLPEIRSVWPKGPYLLAGYSGGGVVAYELAQRLLAEGETVPLLAFLDTFHPATRPRKPTLMERVDRLFAEGPSYISRRGKAKLSRHLEELSSELRVLYYSRQGHALPHELRDLQLTRAFYEASARYEPRPYAGFVTLYRARSIADVYRHMGPALGWKDLIVNLDIIEVPGTHDSLVLEPNVQILASHLASAIAHAVSGRQREEGHT